MSLFTLHRVALASFLALFVVGCGQAEPPADEKSSQRASGLAMDVYKSPTCGCCGDWISHVEQGGFDVTSHHPQNLNQLKADKGIAPRYQSCHMGVSEQGYVFEGHVPVKFIQQFLADVPKDAIGLAVPGMPLGSPGMEVDDRFTPYQVLLLKSDGSSEVYADIASYEQQF